MLLAAIRLANTIQYTDVNEYKEVRKSTKSLMDSLDVKELFALCEVDNFFCGFLSFSPHTQRVGLRSAIMLPATSATVTLFAPPGSGPRRSFD